MNVRNIIIIILDTLRKDYGEKYIDPVLKEYGFVYYPNVISPSPWTIPTHVSIFVGEYPSIHGVHETPLRKIPEIRIDKPILKSLISVLLKKQGYHTVLISANELVQPNFGFVGFEEIYNLFWAPKKILSLGDRNKLEKYSMGKLKYLFTPINLLIHGEFNLLQKAFSELVYQRRILAFLKRYPLEKGVSTAISVLDSLDLEERNFIFINLIEVHEPYSTKYHSLGGMNSTLTGQVTEDLIQDWQSGYVKETKYLANKLRKLLHILQKKGILHNSLLIVTSDHGQLLGEEDRIGHGVFLDDELTRVPLWIGLPGVSNTPFNIKNLKVGYISLVDLYSALLNMAKENTFEIPIRNVVFSESQGIPTKIPLEKLPQKMHSWIEQLEKHRIAVYHGPYKGIYNVDDKILECVKSYDGSEITKDVKDMLIKDVKKFLKQARLKSAVRKIKLKKSL